MKIQIKLYKIRVLNSKKIRFLLLGLKYFKYIKISKSYKIFSFIYINNWINKLKAIYIKFLL